MAQYLHISPPPTYIKFSQHALRFLMFVAEIINTSFIFQTTVRNNSTETTELPYQRMSFIIPIIKLQPKKASGSTSRLCEKEEAVNQKNPFVRVLTTHLIKEVMRKVIKDENINSCSNFNATPIYWPRLRTGLYPVLGHLLQ